MRISAHWSGLSRSRDIPEMIAGGHGLGKDSPRGVPNGLPMQREGCRLCPMPQPIRTREEWAEIHATAVALGSIRAAAKAHGVPEDAAYQRARREKWLVGIPANVQAARAERIERAEAAGVVVSNRVRPTPGPDILHQQIREQGRQTRAMLAQALMHGAGQARRTKHPLARARQIKDLSAAAAQVHPEQFGGGRGGSTVQVAVTLGALADLTD
jgi:hypothetical protein